MVARYAKRHLRAAFPKLPNRSQFKRAAHLLESGYNIRTIQELYQFDFSSSASCHPEPFGELVLSAAEGLSIDMRRVYVELVLLGHKDVKTTMISTHVLNTGGRGVRSPLDDRG